MIECRGTPESDQAIVRLKILGGTVPDLAEINPAKGAGSLHAAEGEATASLRVVGSRKTRIRYDAESGHAVGHEREQRPRKPPRWIGGEPPLRRTNP